jgi:hypothetical protein
MTRPTAVDRRWSARGVAAVTVMLFGAAGLSPASASSSESAVSSIPLATSLQSAAGTWATLPMGHLNEPLNTFWQLLFRPTGTTSWSDKVKATATATNGGLVLASAAGQPFVAGVRPAGLLRFSPLIATTDGGRSWSDGLLPQGLAAGPDSLSTAADGPTLALVDRGGRGRVLVSTGTLSTWRTLTTARRLASGGGGRACGVRSLTAVASLAGDAVVGASCSRPGLVGIFTAQGSAWRLDPLTLPPSQRGGRVQVLGLEETPSGLVALLQSTGTSDRTLFTARTTDGAQWAVSPPLALGPHEHLLSFGPSTGNGLFALTRTSSGVERLRVDGAPDAGWEQLPPPPRGTATVAFDTGTDTDTAGTVDALAVRGSTVTVWTLADAAATGSWARGQRIDIALKFGSSS